MIVVASSLLFPSFSQPEEDEKEDETDTRASSEEHAPFETLPKIQLVNRPLSHFNKEHNRYEPKQEADHPDHPEHEVLHLGVQEFLDPQFLYLPSRWSYFVQRAIACWGMVSTKNKMMNTPTVS